MSDVSPDSSALNNDLPLREPVVLGEKPVPFETVFAAELVAIKKSRLARGATLSTDSATAADPSTLLGLAFSGGGIRSATFNLGILQALAKKRMLSRFDYVSTVSGGGYIGSWLAALTQRLTSNDHPRKFEKVEKALGEHTYEVGRPAEEPAIRWLRNYADYLTPQAGLLSGDTGAMFGTWLRNVILNLIVVVLFLLGATLVPSLLVLLTRDWVMTGPEVSFSVGMLLLTLATVFMGLSMVDFVPWEKNRQENWFRRNGAQLGVMLPYYGAAWLLNASIWAWPEMRQTKLWWWWVGGAVLYTLIWTVTFLLSQTCKNKKEREDRFTKEKELEKGGKTSRSEKRQWVVSWDWMVFSAVFSGAWGGLLFYGYSWALGHIPVNPATVWSVTIFGTVTFMLLMEYIAVIQLGLLGVDCLDLVREWWARAGGQLIQTMGVWLVVFGIVVFGPLGVRILLTKSMVGLGGGLIAWLISNFGGVMAGKSAKTGGEIKSTSAVMKAVNESHSTSWWSSPRVLEFVAKAAPYVFALGLLILLSTAAHILMGLFLDGGDIAVVTKTLWLRRNLWPETTTAEICRSYWLIQSGGMLSKIFAAAAALVAFSAILSARIDINDFSLHHFYRNRLVRCYLGASRLRERKPQSFTGFDPNDDLPLQDLRRDYPGPYPILNASLNATQGGELGFQERKAKSFTFTPLFCGYDLAARLIEASTAGNSGGAYMDTSLGRKDKFGSDRGISLGTAMAISGAAASPNMGHYTSPAAAFFMTLFDVRLGWWIGNPRHREKWRRAGPSPALAYLLKELVAQSDEESNYVYLSDGGHFENLAIYELIKRRCRFIMVCDSGADRGYGCGDLMEAIEKCKTDFGVDIKISVSEIKPAKDQCVSSKTYTVGTIRYGPGGNDRGVLVYVKSSLPADDPKAPVESRLAAGVRSYAEAHQDFPHQSTADQWFDEVQFEAYRALGEYIGTTVADVILGLPPENRPEAFKSPVPPAPPTNDPGPEWLWG